MRNIVLIAHNLRSVHNVGSLLRTADGMGVECVYLTGYTPHPALPSDSRLPHESQKITRQIHKTALGAENTQAWQHHASVEPVITDLKNRGYVICAVEQSADSQQLPRLATSERIALLVGREVEGIEPEILELCGMIAEIPMYGKKESYNVVQAAAMALYHFRFFGS